MFYKQLFLLLLYVAIGISLPVGIQVPKLRVGQDAMLNSRPSKLINEYNEGSGTNDVSKYLPRGIGAITLDENDELGSPTGILKTPIVKREFLELESITDDNQVHFKGDTKPSRKCFLPSGNLGARIRQYHENGKPLLCAVISVGNERRIFGIKATTDSRKLPKTYPKPSLKLRDNDYVMLENRPCIITDIIYLEDIKNPGEEVVVFGKDIFTAELRSHRFLPTDSGDVPYVEKEDYKLLEITEDGNLWLENDSGDVLTVDLPEGQLGAELEARFDAGKIVYCTLLKALGEAKIVRMKVTT